MKLRRRYLLLLCVLFLGLVAGMIRIKAIGTGFDVESKPINEKNTFISDINISLIHEEPAKESIVCFDVNSAGLIALGQSKFEEKTICIYSNAGIFQYGYTFHCSGSFGIEWDENNLNIYFVRGDAIVSITPNGEILDVFEVQDTSANNSYENYLLYSTEKSVGDHEYIMRNDMGILNLFAVSYSQLVVEDIDGTEHVIYNVNAAQLSKTITILVIALLVITFAVVAIVRNGKWHRGQLSVPKK